MSDTEHYSNGLSGGEITSMIQRYSIETTLIPPYASSPHYEFKNKNLKEMPMKELETFLNKIKGKYRVVLPNDAWDGDESFSIVGIPIECNLRKSLNDHFKYLSDGFNFIIKQGQKLEEFITQNNNARSKLAQFEKKESYTVDEKNELKRMLRNQINILKETPCCLKNIKDAFEKVGIPSNQRYFTWAEYKYTIDHSYIKPNVTYGQFKLPLDEEIKNVISITKDFNPFKIPESLEKFIPDENEVITPVVVEERRNYRNYKNFKSRGNSNNFKINKRRNGNRR